MIFQRERGNHAANHAMTEKLAEYDMTAEVSRKGGCRDNAKAVRAFNSEENKSVQGATLATRINAQADPSEYIEVIYNRNRRYSTLDYSTQVRFLEGRIQLSSR